jgi:hypothetical protein
MKYIFYTFICLSLPLFLQCSKTIKDTEYIIFAASYFYVTEIEDTNTAILITDKDSIKYFKDLFFNNELESLCACGFNYRIQFLSRGGTSLENYLYYPNNTYTNNDDKIKEEVKALSSRMNNHPTHYIYNIKIEGDPYSALRKMRINGFLAFIMNDEDNYPSTIQVLYNNDFESLKKELSQFSFIRNVEKALNTLT